MKIKNKLGGHEMYEGKIIIASGSVILEGGKLLVNKDDKDDFYKLPGGTIEKGDIK